MGFFLGGGCQCNIYTIAGENRLIGHPKFATVPKASRAAGSVASSYSVCRTDFSNVI